MKLILGFLLGVALVTAALAQQAANTFKQIRTLSGKEFTEVVVTAVLPDSIRITHDAGTATVSFADLSEELQKRFGYDPVKAAEYAHRTAAAKLEAGNARRDAETAQRKTAMKRLKKTIREVKSDQHRFVGEHIVLTGSLELSDYFNYGYEKAQKTHLAFRLTDGDNNTANLYMMRDIGEPVRKKLLAAKEPLNASCLIVIPKDRFIENSGGIYADILDVVPPVE